MQNTCDKHEMLEDLDGAQTFIPTLSNSPCFTFPSFKMKRRRDGRLGNQLRPMTVDFGGLTEADGSARLTVGAYKRRGRPGWLVELFL